MQGEFRQRLINGAYSIRAYGIHQEDKGQFANEPGYRDWRGGVDTKGQFALNDKWVWGWTRSRCPTRRFFFDIQARPLQERAELVPAGCPTPGCRRSTSPASATAATSTRG